MAKQTPSRVGDFEKSLTELEKIVERMEDGEQSLEVSLKDFERGMTLVRQCRDSLASAEAKVQKLIEKNGKLESVSLDSDKT
ncbi:MAG: exodeoxyribonuclease VII small subunit [Candidatus Thioglobus sp.]|nr:MAG: exodeoxyribonuclease VII small subunit [Candidatus Thioglobus sp.]|tara:strand:- start:36 stop:281 length:246 start_codon:yes stop_codon:yes gene_type:complete